VSAGRFRGAVGMGLQVAGIVLTPMGLIATLAEGGSVHAELTIMVAGLALFYLGRSLSR
jgi:hypothetical protein